MVSTMLMSGLSSPDISENSLFLLELSRAADRGGVASILLRLYGGMKRCPIDGVRNLEEVKL
jgi:hypothetical protein